MLGWLIKKECKSQKDFDIATRAHSDGLRTLLWDIMTTTKEPGVIGEMCRYANKEMIAYALHERVLSKFEGYVVELGPASDFYVHEPVPVAKRDTGSMDLEDIL